MLADPEGHEFCIIEAGNGFLDDTARIGALSCEGTREVGLFWNEALQWPLVWDEGEETAAQSPAGGTKIAWGGPPVAAKGGIEKLRLDLVPSPGSTPGGSGRQRVLHRPDDALSARRGASVSS